MSYVPVVLTGNNSNRFLLAEQALDNNFTELYAGMVGAVPTSRTITINGVTQDLSANRSWTVSGGATNFTDLVDVPASYAGNALKLVRVNAAPNALEFVTADKNLVGLGNVDNTADSAKSVASAATLTTSRKINGPLFNGSADIMTNEYLNLIQGNGSTICGEHWMGRYLFGGSGAAMVNQRVYYQFIYVPKDCTITGLKFFQSVQGDYTANNNNKIGLCTISAGGTTLVASCADDGNLWKGTSNTIITKAFSTPYAATAGWYVAVGLWNRSSQVTAPQLLSLTIPSGFTTLDLADSTKLSAFLSGQTDLPGSQAMSGLTADTSVKWFIPYS